MFEEISEPRESRLRRWSAVLSVLYLGMAIFDSVQFWHRHDSTYALNGALWLVLAVVWAYKYRHVGEPQITKLGINRSQELHGNERE